MHRLEAHKKLAVENLKSCPLCNAVNALQNHECFVCRWHGDFIHDSEVVEEGLMELLDRCPELVDVMLETPLPPPTLWERAVEFCRGVFRKKLDFRA